MRIRPLEMWVFSLLLAVAGVAMLHQYMADQRAAAPQAPYTMTVKVAR
jgi:hypothetical protein